MIMPMMPGRTAPGDADLKPDGMFAAEGAAVIVVVLESRLNCPGIVQKGRDRR